MKKILCLLFTSLLFFSYGHSSSLGWSRPPAILSGATDNASDARIGIDANGNAIAIWIENNEVKSSAKLTNGHWSSVATVSETGASSVNLVVDSFGNAIAVWVENGMIKASVREFNSYWKPPLVLSGSNASSPTLCIDSAGNVIAAWIIAGNIETATKLFNKNWKPNQTINCTSPTNPVIAIGGSGTDTRAYIVWEEVTGGISAVFASTKLILDSWSSPEKISDLEHNAVNAAVAVDSKGEATVWYAYDKVENYFSNVIVQSSAYSSSTGNWDKISTLSNPGIRNPASLTALVAFDRTGNAVALWNTSFDD